MTDRELLELAGKAAGIPLHELADTYGDRGGIEKDGWNPLEDDGAALRLAVKLRLVITVGACNVEARRWAGGGGDMGPMHCQVVAQDGDPYAATRRAIVRAAAEIGRAMQ